MNTRALWNHQVTGIRMAAELRDMALFMEMGTGKTRTTIEILRRKYAEKNRLMKTLILCPPIVCDNWKQEFAMFSKINPHDVVILDKSGKKRIAKFIEAAGNDLSRNKIVITNYESLQMAELYKLIMAWQPEVLVCDESQRLKNPSGIRAKAAAQIADKTLHNYILTGTPILQNSMDAFMQYRILDRGETFGKNQWAFKARYFFDKNSGMPKHVHFPKWVARSDMEPELRAKIQAKSLRVLKSECMDLPPLVKQLVYVDMSPEQARMYKEMLQEFVTWIESKHHEPRAVVAQLAVTKAIRLQQIVSGFAKDEHGVEHTIKSNPRLDALEELLEDIAPHHKVIVWANFIENYRMIARLCDKMKLPYREIHGGIDNKTKQTNMEDFRKDPTVRVMIANQRASGVGVNLVEASYMIYYSKGFGLEDDLQSEARNYRGGSEMHAKVTRIDLVCRGTIDEMVNEALSNKKNISERLIDWRG